MHDDASRMRYNGYDTQNSHPLDISPDVAYHSQVNQPSILSPVLQASSNMLHSESPGLALEGLSPDHSTTARQDSPNTANRASSSGKTFQCTGFDGCNMSFSRSEHLARHIRKHTGERFADMHR